MNWVLDADIRGFFDAMSHSWTLRFLKHRIADKRILRLVAKWLRVGVVEAGREIRSESGAPQGAVISPILANIYLHYVFDLWAHQWRCRNATGDVIVVRYADDTIVGFEHEHEAQAFLHDVQERMGLFDLALHPEKTRLIRFGRYAAKQRAARGEGKPDVFDFLGFTHYCTRSRKWGSFVIGRKTIKKRMLRTLGAIKVELRKRMHDPIVKTGAWVWQMLNGYLNYLRCRATTRASGGSVTRYAGAGCRPCGGEAKRRISTGTALFASPTASFHRSAYDTQCLVTASTPPSEGRARCVSSARRDLCGGRSATSVPTATIRSSAGLQASELQLWDRSYGWFHAVLTCAAIASRIGRRASCA